MVNTKKWLWGSLSIPFLFIVWIAIASRYPDLIFPGPLVVLNEFSVQLSSADFYGHVWISLYRLGIGFSIAAVSAFLVGTLAGLSHPFRLFLNPIVSFFQATPPMAWAPLFILLLDLGNAPMIAVIVMAAFFPILVNVMQGMELIKQSHIRAALSFGANRFQLARYVYLPEVMPAAFTGIITGFGIAWRSLVAAEMIGGDAGLGWLISTSGQMANSSLVMVGIITIGLMALFFEMVLLQPLKKRFISWAPRS
ncbi:ABC transporter permease [Domibacillus sp. A3M-37]|uniref:ABC transporter permease n=1 Tax=Domibacillus sp. A3M-37 TaxID=2962037 RepID=UPI0020B7CEE5|nr:ABC transporter permease [Domibacillus sp. A3M-37]MCP3764786.1 ABC transporter permease [Domibacillus sp. A3M-37]